MKCLLGRLPSRELNIGDTFKQELRLISSNRYLTMRFPITPTPIEVANDIRCSPRHGGATSTSKNLKWHDTRLGFFFISAFIFLQHMAYMLRSWSSKKKGPQTNSGHRSFMCIIIDGGGRFLLNLKSGIISLSLLLFKVGRHNSSCHAIKEKETRLLAYLGHRWEKSIIVSWHWQ